MSSASVVAQTAAKITGRIDMVQNGAIWGILSSLVAEIVSYGKYPEDYHEYREVLPDYQNTAVVTTQQLIDAILDETGTEIGNVRTMELLMADDQPLQSVLPRHTVLTKGVLLDNSYYRAGRNINLYSSTPFKNIMIGFYEGPRKILGEYDGDGYWPFRELYAAMLEGACAGMYRDAGDDKSYMMHQQNYQRLLSIFRADRADGEQI